MSATIATRRTVTLARRVASHVQALEVSLTGRRSSPDPLEGLACAVRQSAAPSPGDRRPAP